MQRIDAEAEASGSETRYGSYVLEPQGDSLILRMDNMGDISFKGCLLFAFTMLCVFILGILSVFQTARTTDRVSLGDPSRLFEPQQNHFGFLWLVATIMVLGGIPIYIHLAYRAPLTYEFRKSELLFLRNGRRVTQFSRIEYVLLRESRDTDGRYLYLLDISYNDGMRMLLYNDYDERKTMNLANQIASVVGCRVVWK